MGGFEACDIEDGGGDVDAEGEVLVELGFSGGGWGDDEGDADGVFISDDFAGEAVFAEEPAVVALHDDPSVVADAEAVEFIEDGAEGAVHLFDGGVVVAGVGLDGFVGCELVDEIFSFDFGAVFAGELAVIPRSV